MQDLNKPYHRKHCNKEEMLLLCDSRQKCQLKSVPIKLQFKDDDQVQHITQNPSSCLTVERAAALLVSHFLILTHKM